MASSIEIVVTARDEASRVLENVKNQLVVFDQFGRVASNLEQPIQRTERAVTQLDTSFLRAGRSVKLLALPLISELSPALGSTASQLAGVATSAAILGSGMVSLGLAAAGVAGLLLGQLVSGLRAAAAAKEAFDKALRTGDIAKMTEEVTKLGGEIEKLQQIRLLEQGGPMALQVARDVAARGAQLGAEAINRDAMRRAAAMQQADLEDRLAVQAFEERQTQLRMDNRRAQRGLFDFRLPAIDAEFAQAERDAEDLRRAGDPAAAARALDRARRVRAITRGFGLAAGEPDLSAIPRIFGTEQDVALGQQAIARGLALAAGEEDLSRIAPISGREQDVALATKAETDRLKLVREESQLKSGLIELEQHRLEILGALTPELSAQLTLMQAAVIAADETLTPQQKQLALAQANLAVMKQMVSLDPLAGLVAGFSRVATESRKLGTELERFADETAGNMSRSFSDHFFNLFTGRKGQDLGRQFGDAMLRSFTDLLGRQLSGAMSGILARTLGGFGAVLPGGGGGGFDLLSLLVGGGGGGGAPILSSTGAPAGSLVMTQAGLGQVLPSGAVQLVSGGGGGGIGNVSSFIPNPSTLETGFNLLTGRGPSLFDYGSAFLAGGSNALSALQAGQAVVSGGQFISNAGELASLGIASPGTFGSAAGTAVSGASALSAAAGGVLAGVALGFTIYSGLQGAPTAQNIAMGAVSGAISGAALGGAAAAGAAYIAGAALAPATFGISLAVGAVAGALLGGGAAAMGKGGAAGRRPSPNERSAAVAQMAAGNLSAAIDAAQSLEDLQQILNMRWSPYNEVNIVAWDRDTHWVGAWTNGPPGAALALVKGNGEGGPPFPDVATMLADSRYLDFLEIQVGAGGSAVYRQDLTDKFKTKWADLLETFSNIPFGILESDRAAGLTRRTYLPFQQLYGLTPGAQQLFFSSDFYRRDLGATDDTIAFLIDRIREHSVRRDIDMTREDFIFR